MTFLERADGSRRVGLWSLVGLLLVPLVLAGGFLAATWKSTDRLDRVQAAVVNLDEPVTLSVDGKKQLVPLGRQLAGGLVDGDGSDSNFAWVLTDAADAGSGLDSGRYAAVVTIPKDFSAHATSYSDQSGDTAQQAVLDVATSPVSGVSDPVVGQAITAAATRALNSQLTEQYVKNVYVGFNSTKKQFTKVADAAHQLADGTTKLADGLDQTADGTAQLSDGLNQLDDGGPKLARGAKQLSSGLDQYTDGVSGISKGLGIYQRSLRDQADRAGSAKQPSAPTAASLGQAIAERTPTGSLPTCDQIDPTLSAEQCARVQGALGATAEATGKAATTTALTVAGEQFGAYAKELATYAGGQGAAKALDGAAGGLSRKDPKTGQSLRSGAAKLAGGGAKLADGAGDLSTGVAQYTGGVHGVADGAGRLSGGLAKLSSGADKLADGSTQLSDGLAKGAKQIPTYDATARDRLSTVVATPVTTPKVTSVFSNVATTTLLAVLALWVGGLASYLVLRAVSARALSSMKSSWRLTLESLLPAAVVALVQAVVLTVLLTALLDLGTGASARLLGLSALAGSAFVALNQALVAWFGGVGRFVSVVLVVLSAAAALTSAVPRAFDSVTPLLPLTPALQGMRAIATGADGGGGAAGLLLAWLVVGLTAGVLATARRRMLRTASLVPAVVR